MDLSQAKEDTSENLRALQMNLDRCVDEGMIDVESAYHNQVLTLIDETSLSQNWEELMEVVTKAKTLEVDVAAWLANRGETTISLPWPRPPQKRE